MQSARRRGTQSRVPRITPWAEGGAKPLGHPGCPSPEACYPHAVALSILLWVGPLVLDLSLTSPAPRHRAHGGSGLPAGEHRVPCGPTGEQGRSLSHSLLGGPAGDSVSGRSGCAVALGLVRGTGDTCSLLTLWPVKGKQVTSLPPGSPHPSFLPPHCSSLVAVWAEAWWGPSHLPCVRIPVRGHCARGVDWWVRRCLSA